TAFQGAGVLLDKPNSAVTNQNVVLANNDLVENAIGVQISGDGSNNPTSLGNVDLGGGSLGSPGGNDFHGYNSTSNGRAAISTLNILSNSSIVVRAENNLWSSNPVLANVNDPAFGSAVDVSPTLEGNHAFVQRLYGDFLLRNGAAAE